jgi:hypothetical protein
MKAINRKKQREDAKEKHEGSKRRTKEGMRGRNKWKTAKGGKKRSRKREGEMVDNKRRQQIKAAKEGSKGSQR